MADYEDDPISNPFEGNNLSAKKKVTIAEPNDEIAP
jgi:hypothetical protein